MQLEKTITKSSYDRKRRRRGCCRVDIDIFSTLYPRTQLRCYERSEMESEQLGVIEVKRNYIAKKENTLLLPAIIWREKEQRLFFSVLDYSQIHIPGYGKGSQE